MTMLVLWFKRLILASAAFVLVACTGAEDVDKAPDPIGNFLLGHTIVVANQVKKGPFSRDSTAEELVNAVKPALTNVFGAYDGDKYYHIAVSIDAYVLALPGIPVVASPKSTLIMGLTIWDDSTQTKLNDPPEQIIVLEDLSAKNILGSGLTQSKEEQLASLAKAAAKEIRKWMTENEHLFQPSEEPEPETDPESET